MTVSGFRQRVKGLIRRTFVDEFLANVNIDESSFFRKYIVKYIFLSRKKFPQLFGRDFARFGTRSDLRSFQSLSPPFVMIVLRTGAEK